MPTGDGKFIYVPYVLWFASVIFLLVWQINSLSDFEPVIGITARDLYGRTDNLDWLDSQIRFHVFATDI